MASSQLSSLLFLPPPPVPSSPASLKAAYGPALKAALKTVVSKETYGTNVLEIALSCPQLHERLRLPRSQIFPEATHLLAGLYSLACIICAEENIEPEGAGGVDFRVLLVAYTSSEAYASDGSLQSLRKTVFGPIIDLPTLALTKRQWQYIFQMDGEQGLEMFTNYMNLATRMNPAVKCEKHIVSGGISMVSQVLPSSQTPEQIVPTHAVVAVGGTFDHLHAGHKLLLTATALLLQPKVRVNDPPRRLIVGITGDELLKNKKYAEYLGSWRSRQEDVVDFLLSILSPTKTSSLDIEVINHNEPVANGKAIHTHLKRESLVIECVEIQDAFGPTITDETITALVVSGETRSGGAAVNDKRKEKAWNALEIFEVDVLDANPNELGATTTENFDAKISSTAIRKRKADEATSEKASL